MKSSHFSFIPTFVAQDQDTKMIEIDVEEISDPLESPSTPELLNHSKILSCKVCMKIFYSQKKLFQHNSKHELIRAQKQANLN